MKLAKNGKESKAPMAPAEIDERGLVRRAGYTFRVPSRRVSGGEDGPDRASTCGQQSKEW